MAQLIMLYISILFELIVSKRRHDVKNSIIININNLYFFVFQCYMFVVFNVYRFILILILILNAKKYPC